MRRLERVWLSIAVWVISVPVTAREIVWPPLHKPGPWSEPSAIIIPDPYAGNGFDFDKAFSDPKIEAVIFKGAEGLTVDPAVYARAAEAKRRGIPFGVYLLAMSSKPWVGKSGATHKGQDAIAQADLLVKIAHETGSNLLALDIEGIESRFMAAEDVAAAATRIEQTTKPRRYPLLYANKTTVRIYAAKHYGLAVLAHMPLWLAGLPGYIPNRIWPNYALLQFGAEWDCDAFLAQFPKDERQKQATQKNCGRYTRYPVAGSRYDLDINVLNGGPAEFDHLFGPPQN